MEINQDIIKKNPPSVGGNMEVSLIAPIITPDVLERIKLHPFVNNYIPKLSDIEFASLEHSIIKRGGIINPITLFHDTITNELYCIDGSARLAIAKKNPKIKPSFIFYFGNESSILEHIIKKNIKSRKLNESQIVEIAVKAYKYVIENKVRDNNFEFLGINFNEDKMIRATLAKYFAISETLLANALTESKEQHELTEEISNASKTLDEASQLATCSNFEIENAGNIHSSNSVIKYASLTKNNVTRITIKIDRI